jgi:hypothetical protein
MTKSAAIEMTMPLTPTMGSSSMPKDQNPFVLDGEPLSCVSAGLSFGIIGSAPVSVVFLCPETGIPHLSGVGVADGYKTPAQAGNTVAASNSAERTPAPVFGAISQIRITVMPTKKTKGAKRASKASAVPETRVVRFTFSDRNAALLIRTYHNTIPNITAGLAAHAIKFGTLLDPPGEPRYMEVRRDRTPATPMTIRLPFYVASALERVGRDELGLSLPASLAFLMTRCAAFAFGYPASASDESWREKFGDNAGEEWKKGGAS